MKRWLSACLALCLLGGTRSAHAEPTKEQCVDAYRKSQQLRREGAFRAEIEQLLVCARNPCPAALQPDCMQWLDEARSLVPTVVIKARADGADTADVRVSMDGSELTPRLDGRAIPVDRGEHVFTFDHEGSPRIEKKLLIAEGEKGRVIEVVFASNGAVTSPEARPQPRHAPTRWPVYVLGGVGVLGLGTFATFGTLGMVERGDLSSCKPRCSQHQADAVATKFAVADSGLAVGLVALAGAGIVYLLSGSGR